MPIDPARIIHKSVSIDLVKTFNFQASNLMQHISIAYISHRISNKGESTQAIRWDKCAVENENNVRGIRP